MNRLARILFVGILLLCFSGCDLEAKPVERVSSGETVQAADGMEVAGVTEATEKTQTRLPGQETVKKDGNSEPLAAWEDDAVRALVPAPPGIVSQYSGDGLTAQIGSVSMDDLESYCQQLLDAGFDAYHASRSFYSNTGAQFSFYGRSTDGIVVCVNTESVRASGFSEIEIKDYRTGPAEGDPWGADEYQQLLPDPGCGFTQNQQQEYLYEGQQTRHYIVRFSRSMGYEECKAYAQALRDSGYLYRETVSDKPFMEQYSFCAENADGYMVRLSVQESDGANLMLFEPGMDGPGRDWDDVYNRAFLPEPACGNYAQWDSSYLSADSITWRLAGMDYEAVKAYAQALLDKGYTDITVQEDDPAAQTYVLEASGIISKTGEEAVKNQFYVRLTFDPAQTLEDGTPYGILKMDTAFSLTQAG